MPISLVNVCVGTRRRISIDLKEISIMKRRSVRRREQGFLLAELVIYITLLGLLLSMAQLAISANLSETRRFDEVSRQFYYTLKRTQFISFNGSTGPIINPINTLYVNPEAYSSNLYGDMWGTQYIQLPSTMKLVNNSRLQQAVYLGSYDGQNDVFSYEIYDYPLRVYRKFIFSQQTPRIRWVEGSF